jgi:hypothetical protein
VNLVSAPAGYGKSTLVSSWLEVYERPGVHGTGKEPGATNPDKGFFVVFRFYGPLEGYIEKTWVMSDFEVVQ